MSTTKMRVAVIGAGISGLVSAYVLAKAGVEVVLYEKEDYLGGHAKTVTFDGVDLDHGFMVFNRMPTFFGLKKGLHVFHALNANKVHNVQLTFFGLKKDLHVFHAFNADKAHNVTYPNMMQFFKSLGVDMEISDMSFSVSLDKGQGCEWGSRNGFSSLFAQKKNVLNPYFWQMIREMVKYKDDAINYLGELESNPDIDRNETLGQFVKSRGYSEIFLKSHGVTPKYF